MDNLVIQLGIGLGLQNAIGWFPPVYYGIVNVLPMLLTLFFYADKSTEFNKNTVIKRSDGIDPEIRYDFIIGKSLFFNFSKFSEFPNNCELTFMQFV